MSAAEPAFPWDETMAFGFGVLRLSSAAFWAMTPREIAAAARSLRGRGPAPLAPPGAADLAALVAAFPDEVSP